MKIVICDDREFELEILRTMCEEYAAEYPHSCYRDAAEKRHRD